MADIQLNPIICTIDIETAATDVHAAIYTIGAVVGNVFTGEILDEFYVRVKHEGQSQRSVDDRTLNHFWGDFDKVSREAHKEAMDKALYREPLGKALSKFNEFMRKQPKHTQLFGNGPEFDNAIIMDAMAECAITPAWRHWCNQSIRTLVWTGRILANIDPKYTTPFKGLPHHALDDARHEFRYACDIIKQIKDKIEVIDDSVTDDQHGEELVEVNYLGETYQLPRALARILEKETHHKHPIYFDKGVLKWSPRALQVSEGNDLTEMIKALPEQDRGKNSEPRRALYRNLGVSLHMYWEVFYWEVNNPDVDKYQIPTN